MHVESKGAKISNRYNQVPYLTQDTNGEMTNSQISTPNESQEVSPSPAGGHKANINRRVQKHSKHKKEKESPLDKSSQLKIRLFGSLMPSSIICHHNACRK